MDEMPNAWETTWGFDEQNPSDAFLDADRDGALNIHECESGTDPRDAASHLKLEIGSLGPDVRFHFLALPDRSYTLQYRKNLEAAQNEKTYFTVTNVKAMPLTRPVTVVDRSAVYHADGYYRLVTPARE